MKSNFIMLANYNAWANERLYEAAAALSEEELNADRGAFFGSMLGTLNHLLVADRIWVCRFVGDKNEPRDLNAIQHTILAELRAARKQEDQRIVEYIASLDDQSLEGTIKYRTTRTPTDMEQHLAPLLINFFNHQTHHRGQAHCILTGLKGDAPSLDLFVYQRQTGVSFVKGAGGVSLLPEKRPERAF